MRVLWEELGFAGYMLEHKRQPQDANRGEIEVGWLSGAART